MTFRGRISALLASIAVVATLAVVLLALQSTRHQLYAEVDASLARVASAPVWQQLAGLPPALRGSADRLPPGAARLPGDVLDELVRVELVEDGRTVVLVGDDPLELADRDVRSAAQGEARLVDSEDQGVPYRVLLQPGPATGQVLVVAQSVAAESAVLAGLAWRLALVGLAVAGGASALGWLAAGSLVRPLEQLTKAAE